MKPSNLYSTNLILSVLALSFKWLISTGSLLIYETEGFFQFLLYIPFISLGLSIAWLGVSIGVGVGLKKGLIGPYQELLDQTPQRSVWSRWSIKHWWVQKAVACIP